MRLLSLSLSRFAASCLLPGAFLVAVVGSAQAAEPAAPAAPFGADDIVFDRSQGEWSEAYLQWVATFARDSSPVSDTTGARCAAKQEGDVWFLATSDGTAPVVRACAVPAGKTLFVPIAGTWSGRATAIRTATRWRASPPTTSRTT